MDSLNTLLKSAYASAKKGDYQAAFEEFKIVLSHNPHHVGALFGAAACQYRMSNPALALEFLDRLLKVHPTHPEGVKLYREIQEGGLSSPGVGVAGKTPFAPESDFVDPFGTGLDRQNRSVEIIPEWKSPGRDAPGTLELFREGRTTCLGSLRIGRAYLDAWRFYRANFRKVYLATWVCLLVWVLLWIPFSLWFLQVLREGFIMRIVGLIGGLFLYPTAGLLSCYCFRLRTQDEVPLSQIYYFLAYYPGILFSLGWTLLPIPLGISSLYGCLRVIEMFTDVPLASVAYPHLGKVGIIALAYLWCRCWFLHQSAYSNLDDHPLTVLGRAYHATRWQHIRLLFFIAFQTLFLIVGTLLFGLGIGWVHAAQTEAFLQTQREPQFEPELEDIGFIPKQRTD